MHATKKQKMALNTAQTLLERYWNGEIPVPVAALIQQEGIAIHYMDDVPIHGKWHPSRDTIVVKPGLEAWEEASILAHNLGLACSVEDADLFALALRMPEKHFVHVLVKDKKTLQQAADFFETSREECLVWADFLKKTDVIDQSFTLF